MKARDTSEKKLVKRHCCVPRLFFETWRFTFIFSNLFPTLCVRLLFEFRALVCLSAVEVGFRAFSHVEDEGPLLSWGQVLCWSSRVSTSWRKGVRWRGRPRTTSSSGRYQLDVRASNFDYYRIIFSVCGRWSKNQSNNLQIIVILKTIL